ncbi:DSC E3 ubiquitin ligase complex subunit 1 [Seminavis robusta]|uniref:RING-type E3 ubiquitin transferase n=1 Tax=Seminavis robusta TaxID=568900 RepID=A0A9N8HX66_9STRA|nr:DSC E3 ubiquitin ligase complex subunit 1 [Seminavis robusta]|eukprot:Sro2946_g340760.1 DSC E3 ubiquitin ligase complex subunit 1 (1165) ;mRNA; f:1653-5147
MDNNNNNTNNNPGGEVLAPWDPMNMNPNNLDATQAAAWRERERRQRTIRLLMMFLLMLLLMDSEEQSARKRAEPRHKRNHHKAHLSAQVFGARQTQELKLLELTQTHLRYKQLMEKNGAKDVPVDVKLWAQQQAEIVKDEFVAASNPQHDAHQQATTQQEEHDPEQDKTVFHYPWNATGFYRGEWIREDDQTEEGERKEDGTDTQDASTTASDVNTRSSSTINSAATNANSIKTTERRNKETYEEEVVIPTQYIDAVALESEMLQTMKERNEGLGVFLLPPGKEVILRYDQSNFTNFDWQRYSSSPPKGADHYYMRTGGASASSSSTTKTHKDGYHTAGGGSDSSSASLMSTHANPSTVNAKVTLTKGSGRAAFQLFSRSIPAMQEISLVDGFLKLYDSNMPGYSTHKDILLRVRGVLIHSIGRMSLVSNAGPGRSVLVLSDEKDGTSIQHHVDDAADGNASEEEEEDEEPDLGHRRRRLEEELAKIGDTTTKPSSNNNNQDVLNMNQIRDDAIALFDGSSSATTSSKKKRGKKGLIAKKSGTINRFKFETPNYEEQSAQGEVDATEETAASDVHDGDEDPSPRVAIIKERRTQVVDDTRVPGDEDILDHHPNNTDEEEETNSPGKFTWSNVVIPYPFVVDDEDESIRKAKTPAARKMPPREQLLERNAGICEFEVTMDTKEVEWTVGEWRKLVGRRVKETMDLNPANHPLQTENEDSVEEHRSDRKSHRMGYGGSSKSSKSSREHHNRKPIQDQALIMTMTGSIHSPNCDFTASLNVTALRTDWEHTTGKAINYSFYMMLTCLTQIMVLLRQLLHTQAQSAATRVSLLCIGWQTVLDALLCLGHIYLSLAMQPLFTAFASVAFFKLLIFCVIEMKYMALIIQARNSSNGGNSTELLRRQVAMLHLRFYVALFGAFLAFFYAGDKYRIPYNLVLYSFWVPQIVQNVITEAKRPMHNYYIYGMSLTRLVAPLYIFAVPNNFLKEVYPESPTDLYMCELLVLWVGIQAAVLIAQGKYGARFMIPARFLPPKFDYSRPIPTSMLPPGATQEEMPLRQGRNQENSSSLPEPQSLLSNDRHPTTRNRIKGSRVNRPESTMTAETVVNDTNAQASGHTLDCVICYNPIDVHNRRGYMLAPCDHIFHKDCLVQWMDVKMECPICRTELPSL